MMERQWGLITIPHGIKRPAEDSLEGEQPLAKRLSRLSLENHRNVDDVNADIPQPLRREQPTQKILGEAPMQLDDTKDRIYIYNLEDELSDSESQDERLVFIPEIEKQLTKIPKSVLTSPTPPAPGNELVLYNVPSSLSVPEEQDSVRKAIIETRARARERQAESSRSLEQQEGVSENAVLATELEQTQMELVPSEDADAMDIG